MIDWLNLIYNTLWILGLALALATLSSTSWEASRDHEKFRVRLNRPATHIALNLAGVLFCAGLATTSKKTYEIILWAILGVAFAGQMIYLMISSSNHPAPPPSPPGAG